MKGREGLKPGKYSVLSLISVCLKAEALEGEMLLLHTEKLSPATCVAALFIFQG